MTGTLNGSWWQYSKWIFSIGRSLLINPPSTAERSAVTTFVRTFWNAASSTGTRPWLATEFNFDAVWQPDQYRGDVNMEPDQVDCKMVQEIGRDLKKIPMTDAEKIVCDTFMTATGDRKYYRP